jgi:chromosome segregation ATPase
VECEKSLGFSGTAKDGAQRSRSAIQKDLERLQEDFDKLNFTRYHFENESIDLAKEVRSCQTAKGECEEAKKDVDKGWRQTNITLVKVKKDVANLTSLWNTCLTEKGEQEGYADDLQGNLTICLGDLTTSKTAETTNEKIITELKENIKGKKSIQGVKF